MKGRIKWRLVLSIVGVLLAVGLGGALVSAGGPGYLSGNPSACGTCHIMQPYVDSYQQSNFLDSLHGKSGEVTCKNCHQLTLVQQTKQVMAFLTKSYTLPIEQDPQAQQSCSSCHSTQEIIGPIRSIAKYSQNPDLSYHLTVENGRAGCYDLKVATVQCVDCHKVHQSGVNYCNSCHYVRFSAPSM